MRIARLGTVVYSVQCEDYFVRNRQILLHNCVEMDDMEVLERKRIVLDKYHTRLRHSFRLGMVAAVTENGVSRSTKRREQDPFEHNEWPGTAREVPPPPVSGEKRLLNGERGRVVDVMTRDEELIVVKVTSITIKWTGVREIKRMASSKDVLLSRSVLEGRSVRFESNGVERGGKVMTRQVPLILELALTVHKAQGMTLGLAVFDMGCPTSAYST